MVAQQGGRSQPEERSLEIWVGKIRRLLKVGLKQLGTQIQQWLSLGWTVDVLVACTASEA